MPGSSMDGFTGHAVSIASAGIYNFRVHFEQVLLPVVMMHWRIESIEGLNPAAERAREHLLWWMSRMQRIANRMEEQSAETPVIESQVGRRSMTGWASTSAP